MKTIYLMVVTLTLFSGFLYAGGIGDVKPKQKCLL